MAAAAAATTTTRQAIRLAGDPVLRHVSRAVSVKEIIAARDFPAGDVGQLGVARTERADAASLNAPAKTPSELAECVAAMHSALAAFRREHGFGRAISAPQVGADCLLHSPHLSSVLTSLPIPPLPFPSLLCPKVGFNLQAVALNLSGIRPTSNAAGSALAFRIPDGPFTMFNPRLSNPSAARITLWDDCLSHPDVLVRVSRAAHIDLGFLDEHGQPQSWPSLPTDLSELMQHECDHLDGVLALDRAEAHEHSDHPPVVERAKFFANRAAYAALVDYAIY